MTEVRLQLTRQRLEQRARDRRETKEFILAEVVHLAKHRPGDIVTAQLTFGKAPCTTVCMQCKCIVWPGEPVTMMQGKTFCSDCWPVTGAADETPDMEAQR